MGRSGGESFTPSSCCSSAMVHHPDLIVAEAISAVLRTTAVVGRASATDRVKTLLRFQDVPSLIVLADPGVVEVGDISEALTHRGVAVPLMTCRDPVTAGGVVQDLLDGASGVAALTSSPRRFAAVARTVADGGLTIPVHVRPAVLPALVQAAVEHARARARLAAMTPRQRQVLGLMAMGHGHHGVAARLGLAVTTARTHADRVRAKLDADSQLDAAIRARTTLRLGTAPVRPVEALFEAVDAAPQQAGGPDESAEGSVVAGG
jgi:DNA-binding NarL/FixJ family response regulator